MADLMTSSTTYNKLASQYGNFIVPEMKIKVNGQDTVTSMNLDIQEITVTVSLKAAGYAVFKIGNCYNMETSSFSSDIKDKFKPGTVVSIELGYLSHTELVFKGYVAMLGAEIREGRYLVVTLMDARRLMITGGKKHMLHDVKKYSDAFQSVIGNYSKLCTAQVDATNEQLESPISQTSSDYDFITKQLVKKGNREFFIFADKAYYRKIDSSKNAIMSLKPDQLLLDFQVDYEYLDAKIKVLGYDYAKEEAVFYEEEVTGDLDQSKVMEKPEYVIVDEDIDTKEKAQNLAMFIGKQEKRRTCSGRGRTIGLPELVPGRYVAIEEIDSMVNKKYYLTEVKHSIGKAGFITEFEIGGMSS